ncbi:RcnB family protein [Xanthomonas sp. NCPPB 1067]|uniref:RcnB family protein n=1 Tax=Xanthomonas TaxID=338 RepID=UPI001E2BB996|nr:MULTISPECIES: RcnB family protein [Xanthomonas]MCC4589010.1 RcnB family protein [Xanthomonas sp. NCPPB 1067]MCD0246780.1 RcnB family protein [Xanthomonas melonis]
MNRKCIVTVVLSSILALGAVAPAAADDWDRRHDRDRRHHDDRRDHRHWRAERHDDRRYDRREWRQDRRVYSHGYREGYRDARYRDRYRRGYTYVPAPVYYDAPRYYGGPRYVRGHRYHGPVYVVNDYDRYNLRYPPRGYRWQRDNTGNFLLVAIATGVIADLVLNN